MLRSTSRLTAVCLACAITAAGCGSDDATTTAGETAASPVTASSTTSSAPAPTTTIPTTNPTTTSSTTSSTPTTTTPSSTIAPATTMAPPVNTSTGDCRRLDDFDLDAGTWVIVNDGVMGGRSNGRRTITDSTLRFSGTVVTAGGGFTSVRLRLDGTELDGTDFIRARLRADDRTYRFTFEDDQAIQRRAISHGADLPVAGQVDADGFAVVEVPYTDLRPSVFGQPVDSEPFDPDSASEIGIIIGDGIDGDFALEVDWIDACGPAVEPG